MTDWEHYAQIQPINEDSYRAEPTQWARVSKILDRCVGSVLDVGGGDGWIARQLMDRGHDVTMLEASQLRCNRARELGVHALCIDLYEPFRVLEDYGSGDYCRFDTVLLGEVLEHLDDPGQLLRDAFRIARERVIITVPLQGWPDPTHQWRISLDHYATPDPREDRPDSSEQVILTWQRGLAWPLGYHRNDDRWRQQFEEGR